MLSFDLSIFPFSNQYSWNKPSFKECLHLGAKICSQLSFFWCLNPCLMWRPSVMNPWNGVFQAALPKPISHKLVALHSGNTEVVTWVTEVIPQLCRNNHRSPLALPAARWLLQGAFCLPNQFGCPCGRHRAPGRMSPFIIPDPILGSSCWGWPLAPRVEGHGHLQGLKVGNIHGFVLPAPRWDSSELQ